MMVSFWFGKIEIYGFINWIFGFFVFVFIGSVLFIGF